VRALSALQPVHNAAAAAKIKKYPKCMDAWAELARNRRTSQPGRQAGTSFEAEVADSLARFGINDDRDWAVVGEADDHLRTKFTGLDGLPDPASIVQGNVRRAARRLRVWRSGYKMGDCLCGAGEQGELTDEQNFTATSCTERFITLGRR